MHILSCRPPAHTQEAGVGVGVGVNVTLFPIELSNCNTHVSVVSRVRWLYTHQLTSEFYMPKYVRGERSWGVGGGGAREYYQEHALTIITNTDMAIIHWLVFNHNTHWKCISNFTQSETSTKLFCTCKTNRKSRSMFRPTWHRNITL